MNISNGWKSDIILILFIVIFLFLTIYIPKKLKEKDIISKKATRKIIHSLSGLCIFIVPFLNHPIIAVLISLVMTISLRLSKKKSNIKTFKGLYHLINEDEEEILGYLQGPYAYALSITILMFSFLFYRDYYFIPISTILIMMYADTLAGLLGKKYGKHHINVPLVGNKRTLEGSFVFFIVAIICSFLVYYIQYKLIDNSIISDIKTIWVLSLIMSTITCLLELISPSKYDDLIIPIGGVILIIPFLVFLN